MKAKDKILVAAKAEFFANGIKRVNVGAIYEAANVSKMTFYRQFKNKEDLLVQLFRKMFDESMAEYKKITDQNLSFRETLTQLTELKIQFTKNMSKSFIEEFFALFRDKAEVIQEIIEMQKEGRSLFVQEIMKARASGEIRQDISIEFMLSILDHLQLLMDDPQYLNVFSSSEEMIRETTNFYFFGIYGPAK